MPTKKDPDPSEAARLKALYSKQLEPSSWVSSADTLTVTLHWLQPYLDDAENRFQQQIKDRRAGKEVESDVMRPHLELLTGRVFLMLAGYALEDLFKGYIVASTPKPSKPTGGTKKSKGGQKRERDLPRELEGHDLLTLARKTPIKLSDDEKTMLSHLSAITVWWGRYPVPMSHLDFEHRLEDGTRRTTPQLRFKITEEMKEGSSWRDAIALVRRLRVELFPHQPTLFQINGVDPREVGLPLILKPPTAN